MKVHQMAVGPFEMNTYIIADDANIDCVLIDPGDDIEKIIQFIDDKKYKPRAIFNTHAHIDHTRRLSEIQKHYKIPYFLGEEDLPLVETLSNQGLMFGLESAEIPEISGFMEEEHPMKFGNMSLSFFHTPGHSPGSMSIYSEGHVFVGDVLFRDSIGRTDLYGGNYDTLIESIRSKLFTLPDETIVYPGHGPTTTIVYEKQNNPFFKS
jgi:glyoxylase-like metal-dependent hydrolase (beta-lactamase superfamily II)